MNKSTLSLIIMIIISVTVLGIMGEYLTYKYYSLKAGQQTQQIDANSSSNASDNRSNSGSSENAITSFNFKDPMAIGSINQSNHTITITVPPITNITRLVPTVEISKDATISPSSNVSQDFTNTVTYTVTAHNKSAQSYAVTVNVASILTKVEKLITSFKVSGVVGAINNNDYSVYIVVPDGTDLTKLTPTISVSNGANISPASGTVQDFTSPVIYTVTDMYGGIQAYKVTVVTESNSG